MVTHLNGRSCSVCEVWKTFTDFHKKGEGRFSSSCKNCVSVKKRRARKRRLRKMKTIEKVDFRISGKFSEKKVDELEFLLKEIMLSI